MGAEINAGTGKETTSFYSRVLDVAPRAARWTSWATWSGARPCRRSTPSARSCSRRSRCTRTTRRTRSSTSSARPSSASDPLGRAIIGRPEVIRDTPVDAIRAFHARSLPARQHRGRGARARSTTTRLVELARASQPGDERAGQRRRPTGAPALRARACASSARTPSSTTCAWAAPGIARDDDRRFALRVLDNILGGTSSSRLFQEVREQPRPGLLRLHVPQPLRRHRADRPLPGHARGQPRPRRCG